MCSAARDSAGVRRPPASLDQVPGGRLFILFMQTGAEGGPPFDCPLDRMRTLFGDGWSWPQTIAEPVLHGTTTREIPVVLTRI